jgi:hypothetical protein
LNAVIADVLPSPQLTVASNTPTFWHGIVKVSLAVVVATVIKKSDVIPGRPCQLTKGDETPKGESISKILYAWLRHTVPFVPAEYAQTFVGDATPENKDAIFTPISPSLT